MPRYREDEYDDEDRRPYRRERPERAAGPSGHATIGVLSFLAASLSGFLLFGLFVLAGVLTASRGDLPEDSPEAIAAGLGLFAGMGVALLGLILGIIALFQGGNKLFPTLGTTLTALVLMGSAALLCAGALAS